MTKKWEKYRQYARSGDWQFHTSITDGKSTIQEYFEKAAANNLSFLHFSEHVRRKTDYDYLKFKEDVYRIGAQYNTPFAVGAEAKVLDIEGNLDISDEIAKEAELIIFSFHSKFFLSKEAYIEAIIHASQNPIADIWGHPTSYHNWLEFKLTPSDWEQIAKALKMNNACYEINLKYEVPGQEEINAILKNEVEIIFSSDAHHQDDLLDPDKHNKMRELLLIK